MQNNKIFRLFKIWTDTYLDEHNTKIKLVFDETLSMGFGNCNEDKNTITIGIEPYKRNLLSKYQQVKDSDFVKMGVTLFHELTHHIQIYGRIFRTKYPVFCGKHTGGFIIRAKKAWRQLPER